VYKSGAQVIIEYQDAKYAEFLHGSISYELTKRNNPIPEKFNPSAFGRQKA